MKLLRPLFFFTLVLLSSALHAAPSGNELMRGMMKAEENASYSATETMTRVGAPTTIARIQKQGAKKRSEYSAPAIMRGDVWVVDNKTVWRFHKSENNAIKTQAAGNRGNRSFESWSKKFEAKNKGQATLNGRKAWTLAVSPRGDKRVVRKVWIDDKTKIRLRVERFDRSGKRIETYALSNLKFEKIPDSIFNYKPPRGASVTNAGVLYNGLKQAQENVSWLQAPAKLPSGYGFESAVVNQAKGESWLRYSNGVRRFSIFQQRTSDKKSTPLRAVGGGWFWQQGGSRFLIAGLPEDQAKQVAKSCK